MSFLNTNTGWPVVQLEDIIQLKPGYQLPKDERTEGKVPVYAESGQQDFHNKSKASGPAVVIGRTGRVESIQYIEGDYWPLNSLFYVADFKGNDPKWVYYMLKALKLDRLAKAHTIPLLNLKATRNELVPLPPLKEQKIIAAIMAKPEIIRQERQHALDLSDEFLYSVFLDMFGDPATNPKGWKVKPLRDSIISAKPGVTKGEKCPDDTGYIVLKPKNISHAGIIVNKNKSRRLLSEKEKAGDPLNIGDILLIRTHSNPDYVGLSAVCEGVGEDVYHSTGLIKMSLCDAYIPKFLSYCLNSPGGRSLIIHKALAAASALNSINIKDLKSLELYLPPIKLQQDFARILENVKDMSLDSSLDNLFSSLS